MSRPFGVAMLFAGCDEEGPQLYHMDPSGTYIKCTSKAIGAGSDGAEQGLKEELRIGDQPREVTRPIFQVCMNILGLECFIG
jgi:20S proteasome subunit alpha 5